MGRFDYEIQMRIPDEEARHKIIEMLTKDSRIDSKLDLAWIARNTPGYSGADLKMLIRETSMLAAKTYFRDEERLEDICIRLPHFVSAIKNIQPSGKREGFAIVPDVSWEDIGALHQVREELRLLVVEPLAHPEIFRRVGITNPAGVLLWGPPGCGKTLLAKAVANESHSNFISIKGPEILHKYVGESERAVRQIFERAKSSKPCIVFFDELDSLCPKRSYEENNYSARLVNQLLTEMDGLEERQQVYVMAATNRPDIIDNAILRPGRLDKMIYVDLPNSKERHDILIKQTKRTPIADDVDLLGIAYNIKTEGFSGADLGALVREASILSIQEVLSDKILFRMDFKVTRDHFETALDRVFPSVSVEDRRVYENLRLEYTVRRRSGLNGQ
jgi:ribosome biogenesis ATPase